MGRRRGQLVAVGAAACAAPRTDRVGDPLCVRLDTGVRSGADIVAAIALGAQAVLGGRVYFW